MKTRIMHYTQNITIGAWLALLVLIGATNEITYAKPIETRAVSSQALKWHGVPKWVTAKPVWKSCKYEDSINCVWNAKRQGLGGGTSYVATRKDRVIYIKHWQAYRLKRPAYAR